jgi:hypothetical protein
MIMARTAQQIEEIKTSATNLLTKILLERQKLKQPSKIEDRHLKELCSVLLWKFSEAHGSKKQNPLWSKTARQSGSDDKGLVHDHPVPRKVMTEMLFELDRPTERAIRDILDKFCMCAVLAKEEDEKLNSNGLKQHMPKGWDNEDPFARYRQVGIKLSGKK